MVIRFDPSRSLVSRKQAMDEMFKDFPLPFRLWEEQSEEIPLDVYQTDKDIVVKASLSGVKPEDLDVHVQGDMLVIKGEVRAETETKQNDYLVRERRYGEFRRSVTLPTQVKTDKAEAVFENGLLTLTLPKMQPTGPARIKITPRKSLEASK